MGDRQGKMNQTNQFIIAWQRLMHNDMKNPTAHSTLICFISKQFRQVAVWSAWWRGRTSRQWEEQRTRTDRQWVISLILPPCSLMASFVLFQCMNPTTWFLTLVKNVVLNDKVEDCVAVSSLWKTIRRWGDSMFRKRHLEIFFIPVALNSLSD